MYKKVLNLTSDISQLEQINFSLDEILKKYNIDFEQSMPLFLAVEEVFVNICSYAYSADRGVVVVTLKIKNDNSKIKASVSFEDFGVPFNPLEFDNVARSENNLKNSIPGGLGIHLVKQTVENLCYKYENQKNVLSFEKTFGGKGND